MSSISVSTDFNTNRYSSLSFGSYRRNCSISLGSGLLPSPRCAGNLLGPCFNTGPIYGLTPMYFLSFILLNSFQLSLAVLFRYRSLPVFSLGCSYHPFILHYQAILLFLAPRLLWAVTTSGSPFHGIFCRCTQLCITIRAVSCSFATTKEIHVCFFSCP